MQSQELRCCCYALTWFVHVAHTSEPVKVQAFGVGAESLYVYPDDPLDFEYRNDLVHGSDIWCRVSDQLLIQQLTGSRQIEISTANADIAEYVTLEGESLFQLSSVFLSA